MTLLVKTLSYVATVLAALFVGYVAGYSFRGDGITMSSWFLITTYLGAFIGGVFCGLRWTNPSRYAGG